MLIVLPTNAVIPIGFLVNTTQQYVEEIVYWSDSIDAKVNIFDQAATTASMLIPLPLIVSLVVFIVFFGAMSHNNIPYQC